MMPTIDQLIDLGARHGAEMHEAALALAIEPTTAQWEAWYELCEQASARGINAPVLRQGISLLELVREYRKLRHEVNHG